MRHRLSDAAVAAMVVVDQASVQSILEDIPSVVYVSPDEIDSQQLRKDFRSNKMARAKI
jgi:hypothetical protein